MDEARSWDLERESTVYECGCMVGASVAEFSRVLILRWGCSLRCSRC